MVSCVTKTRRCAILTILRCVLKKRTMFTRRCAFRWALVAAAFLVGGGALPLQATMLESAFSTYQFIGDCSDCTRQRQRTLVLHNYTITNQIHITNFVSISYQPD